MTTLNYEIRTANGMFCEKKHMLRPKELDGRIRLYCAKCNEYYVPTDKKITSEVKGQIQKAVLEGFDQPPDAAIIKYNCPKCGHTEAYQWDRQIGHADEEPHVFTKCAKCGFTDKNTFRL